jgi:hypothetical protein
VLLSPITLDGTMFDANAVGTKQAGKVYFEVFSK